jgi:hypothetical protein
MRGRLIISVLAILFMAMLSGCVNEQEQVVSYTTNASINPTCNPNGYKTVIEKVTLGDSWIDKRDALLATGKIIEIRFRSNDPDVLVFEDCTVLAATDAEDYVFQLGKVHKVSYISTMSGNQIQAVTISPEDP